MNLGNLEGGADFGSDADFFFDEGADAPAFPQTTNGQIQALQGPEKERDSIELGKVAQNNLGLQSIPSNSIAPAVAQRQGAEDRNSLKLSSIIDNNKSPEYAPGQLVFDPDEIGEEQTCLGIKNGTCARLHHILVALLLAGLCVWCALLTIRIQELTSQQPAVNLSAASGASASLSDDSSEKLSIRAEIARLAARMEALELLVNQTGIPTPTPTAKTTSTPHQTQSPAASIRPTTARPLVHVFCPYLIVSHLVPIEANGDFVLQFGQIGGHNVWSEPQLGGIEFVRSPQTNSAFWRLATPHGTVIGPTNASDDRVPSVGSWQVLAGFSGVIAAKVRVVCSGIASPTSHPSLHPTTSPSKHPSAFPSDHPTHTPSTNPTKHPSSFPSWNLTMIPTRNPTESPTTIPSSNPATRSPSRDPSLTPTRNPTTPTPTLGPTLSARRMEELLVPVGTIRMWNSLAVPPGWALCDGKVYNGVETPDLRGRFPLGHYNDAALLTRAFGNNSHRVFGENPSDVMYGRGKNATLDIFYVNGFNAHQLSRDELPSHNHGGTLQTSRTTHTHGYTDDVLWPATPNWASIGNGLVQTRHLGRSKTTTIDAQGGQSGHIHSVTLVSDGLNAPHNNVPPFAVVVFIMKVAWVL